MSGVAVYPGSFDPITFGHVGIIKRIAPHYAKLVVLVNSTPRKDYLFSVEERMDLAQKCLKEVPGVQVASFDGLTVNYAQEVGAKVMVRGIRAVADFEYEMAMANINKKLCPEVETMIVFASPEHNYISSRMVKEVAFYKGDLENLVPPVVIEALHKKIEE